MAANIAVVGGGYWGKNLVRNFAGLDALHTICDVDSKALVDYKSQYPDVDTESDYNNILRNKAIAGVVIATPAVIHFQMAKQALQAGKAVFVEKPLALKMEDGKELVVLAEKAGKPLMVGHLLEYHPAAVKLKDMVQQGELGKIQYIYSNRLNLGKIRTEENILWSFAPHDISVILSLMDGEMPGEVATHGGYYLHKDIADVTVTNMSFRSGANAHIFVSWLHPYKEQKLVVIGDSKMAEFNDTSKDKLVVYKHQIEWIEKKPVPRRGEPEVIKTADDEPLKLECREFIDVIKTGKKPRTDGVKGLQVLEILAACQRSLEADGKVMPLGG